jgi:hypothetical protein
MQNQIRKLIAALAVSCAITGCASLAAPSEEKLSSLPLVTYPEAPPQGDFVYRLPAGKPIEMRVIVEGNALTERADYTLNTWLRRDIYLHKKWASEDGRHWVDARSLVGANLSVSLPSYETPQPGEMKLTVNWKGKD